MISRSAHRRRHQKVVRRRVRSGYIAHMRMLRRRVERAVQEEKKVVSGVDGKFVGIKKAIEAVARLFGRQPKAEMATV